MSGTGRTAVALLCGIAMAGVACREQATSLWPEPGTTASSARPASQTSAAPLARASVKPPEPKLDETEAETIQETLEGNFHGNGQRTRVLFLESSQILQAWEENGKERREPVTTAIPPGTRECKVLRSLNAQDFLACMYWITGPGGGRVDGVLFDLKRRTAGEFFSAAINVQLLNTLCSPDTMVGPMPSVTMVEWTTKAGTATSSAEIVVAVESEGWSTKQAAQLRTRPSTQKFCTCDADECPDQPIPPAAKKTITYRLHHDTLTPTAASKRVLQQIAAQWGHNAGLEAWNLAMRGYTQPPTAE
jgi:hypothetical protein